MSSFYNYVFTRKSGSSIYLMMSSNKTRIGERSSYTTNSALLDFYKNKTEQYLQSRYRGKALSFDEISRVACNSGETQTLKPLLPARSRRTESLWQEEGNFLKLS